MPIYWNTKFQTYCNMALSSFTSATKISSYKIMKEWELHNQILSFANKYIITL
jgi:hypothetical protein